MQNDKPLAILGAGNIGTAIAKGLIQSKQFSPEKITLTRRQVEHLDRFKEDGFVTTKDNRRAVKDAEVVIIAVEPQQLNALLSEIAPELDPERHIVISVVSGVDINEILGVIGKGITVVRAMPNTAIAIRESITCIATNRNDSDAVQLATSIFDTVGKTLLVNEEQMLSATALGACGVAFFLRAIRAASQGGIEIGFHFSEALFIAAQTAKGAASLLLDAENHPEYEIDKVTTPRGCTISGLNQMEHAGFSSAMIKGILTSAEIVSKLYPGMGE